MMQSVKPTRRRKVSLSETNRQWADETGNLSRLVNQALIHYKYCLSVSIPSLQRRFNPDELNVILTTFNRFMNAVPMYFVHSIITGLMYITGPTHAGCPFAKMVINHADNGIEATGRQIKSVAAQIQNTPARIVVLAEKRKLHTVDLTGFFHRAIRMADLIATFDSLAEACHSARIKGAISKKECYQKINSHKKQIRALMCHAMPYTDHKFRHSMDQSSLEWNKMVSLYGNPAPAFKETLSLRK